MTQRRSEQLRREAEDARAQVAESLDELRGRMTPGQVVDELTGYAADTGPGEFLRNLRGQILSNPLPLALMGASLTWLMLSSKSSGSRSTSEMMERGQRLARQAADTLGRWGSAAG